MKTVLVAGALICMLGARARGVVIDFEAFPGPDGQLGTFDDVPISAPSLFNNQAQQVTTQFASLGIEFLPDPPLQDQNEILNDSSFTRTAGSDANLLTTLRGIFPYGPIEARFTATVFEVSMAIGLGGPTYAAPNRLEIFDAADALLDSIVASDAVVTLSSLTPIARFRVTATDFANQAAIDDVQFTVVPEPNSLLMLLPAALIGSRIVRRRPNS